MDTAQDVEDVIMNRIRDLDYTRPASLTLAKRIREDLIDIRMSVERIPDILNLLRTKMIRVASSDELFSDSVYEELEKASDGLRAQMDERPTMPNDPMILTGAGASDPNRTVHAAAE